MRDNLLYLAVMASFLAEAAAADTVDVFFSENAFGVELEGSGSINLNELTLFDTLDSFAFFVTPDEGLFGAGANGPIDIYVADEFTAFGSEGPTVVGEGAGDAFGLAVFGPGEVLIVPAGYVSGDPLSFTVSFA